MAGVGTFDKLTKSLANAPTADMVANLGLAVAQAQQALDQNSIAIARKLIDTTVEFGGENYSLLRLGFTPTFYAFTDATVEIKLTFSMSIEQEIGVEASVGGDWKFVSASFSASYSRKFSFEASGTSSIAARLVSLPPPTPFLELLNQLQTQAEQEA